LFKSELTAYDLDFVLKLGQDEEVVSVDQDVSGIFKGAKQFEGVVDPEANPLRWFEFRSCCHTANFALDFGCMPENNRLTGLSQELNSSPPRHITKGTRGRNAAHRRVIIGSVGQT
jgi:hypothetical protein